MDLSDVVLDFHTSAKTDLPKTTVAAAITKRGGHKYGYPYRHTRIFIKNLRPFQKTNIKFIIAIINHEMLHHILDKFVERRNYRNGDVGHWPFAAGLDHLCGWGTVRDNDGIYFCLV